MTALTTRDALAKALHRTWCNSSEHRTKFCTENRADYDRADALIASDAVVDVATLATDETVDAVAEGWYRREQPPFGPVTEWGDLSVIEQWRWRQSASYCLVTLAAVLIEATS